MNLAHHNFFFGCRACLSKGVFKYHMMCFFGDELPVRMRTVESLHQFERNSYGVNGPNVFRDLSTLTSPAFFRLDEMHLLGHVGNCWRKQLVDRRQSTGWTSFCFLFVVPMVVMKNFVLAKTRNAVQDLVKACTISQQWKVTEREVNIMEEAICCWHVFLCYEVAEKRLKPTIFVMNQHMLAHLGYMMREMGPLRAYSCCPIERTIGEYRAAIGSQKEPGKNIENILFHKARVKHCLGGWASCRRPTDRRTSNFEVASNNIAGPQLWSNLTRKSLAVVADECGMNYHNLVSSLACIWSQDSVFMVEETTNVVCITMMWKGNVVYRVQSSFEGRHVRANDLVVLKHLNEYGFVYKFFSQSVLEETRLFAIVDCLCGIWPNNERKFPVWESLTLSEIKVVEVKSITGMAGLIHDINNETIRHVIFPHPHYYK
ncbi:hypothetical protein PHYBLDRAFT_161728 [Phycomyces blakesleeanus NRRL 1555(-)]|uniref:Uncharacterized protein n=1 Tax=Phycomyces blakesleeanus (strain ATCC 8743b / DSM 1359 / FGSC 10004 / NBRC 33097 / NRRL 1555) TaxID=763407 RepID=A0A162V9M7_PHYB8|nr:hypothetical protein PHYBLDRAFT_161728 [Phycomyces blakesleeanus NRRL 1555(-)]OAD81093.1 hypothetical protein PHYBLDRAFT_161728 [Phycomyces blakesleeanus NRRL 1555(-)]|eukprot:XP_018299133.1 hypothetical protein PHYBLDRAFT_161728 [Phycomyces blakesleeanus NRRL 1555(-)]